MEARQFLAPGIAGVGWIKSSDDGLPQTPILSIIQLGFRAEVDVLGDQTAARLWAASLAYISTFPNCTALYWAPLEDNPSSVILLLQCEDAIAWKQFENSASFAPMVPLLTPNCFNRALRADLTTGLDLTNRTLELASFEFSANDAANASRSFLRKWEEFSKSIAANTSDDVICRGAWVEPDAPWLISDETRAIAEVQPRYFLVLMFWRTGNEEAGSALREKAAILSNDIGTVRSTVTTGLRTHTNSRPHRQSIPAVSPMAVELTSSLLCSSCDRKYRHDSRFSSMFDRVCYQSIEDQNAGKRRYPGPNGVFLGPGVISQYAIPKAKFEVGTRVIDILWTESRLLECISSQVWRPLADKWEILYQARVGRGREHGRGGRLALIIRWSSQQGRANHLTNLKNTLRDLASSHGCSTETHSQSLFARGWIWPETKYELVSPFGGGWRCPESHIELISFYVAPNKVDQDAIERTVKDYAMSMFPIPSTGFPPAACLPQGMGWDDEPVSRDGRPALRFTYAVRWERGEGRTEWYNDFMKGAMESYERLGHILDRFQLLAIDVESSLLTPITLN